VKKPSSEGFLTFVLGLLAQRSSEIKRIFQMDLDSFLRLRVFFLEGAFVLLGFF